MNSLKYFDTHNHYNDETFNNELASLMQQHADNNMFINVVGTNLEDSLKAIDIAKQYANAKASVGIHPSNHIKDIKATMESLENIIKQNIDTVIAIGECGLDLHYDSNPHLNEQIALFEAQINLAIKYHLPLILHIRDAHEQTISILQKYINDLPSVIIHCFSDALKYAKVYHDWGCYISFSGCITFKNNDQLRAVLDHLNLDQILTETDCPYLSPVPVRGTINNSNNLVYINQCIANHLGLNLQDFEKKLIANAIKALKLNKHG